MPRNSKKEPEARYLTIAWRDSINKPEDEIVDYFDDLDEARSAVHRLTPEVQAWQIIDNRQQQLVGVYIRK